MENANIERGKKWANQKRLLELRKLPKEIEWMESQPDIVADIKEYEDSIKDEPKAKPKVKDKKASKEA